MRTPTLALALLFAPLCLQDPQDRKPPRPEPPKVGDVAPSFRLNDHTGRAVAVGGPSKTWTVVAFYPKAATPG